MDKSDLIVKMLESIDRKVDKLEEKVDSLESFKNRLVGMSIFVGAIFTTCVEVIKKIIGC